MNIVCVIYLVFINKYSLRDLPCVHQWIYSACFTWCSSINIFCVIHLVFINEYILRALPCAHQGIYSVCFRPVFHLYVNVKREHEKSNKRFSIVCIPYRRERDVNVKREFMTCDRETRAWNQSLHVAIFHVHAQHSRARNNNKRTSFYARGNREINWIHHKCPVLYEQSLK